MIVSDPGSHGATPAQLIVTSIVWRGSRVSPSCSAGAGNARAGRQQRSRAWGMTRRRRPTLLLCRGLLAFTTAPLAGEVDPAAKLVHNLVMLAVVLLAGNVAMSPRQVRRRRRGAHRPLTAPAAPRTPPAPTAARPLSGRRARRRSPAARAAPRPGPPRTGPAPSRPPREGAAHGLARARRAARGSRRPVARALRRPPAPRGPPPRGRAPGPGRSAPRARGRP